MISKTMNIIQIDPEDWERAVRVLSDQFPDVQISNGGESMSIAGIVIMKK